MIAKIRGISFNPNAIVVSVDFLLEEGEYGFEKYEIDVFDYPPTEADPEPPTHKEVVPFRTLPMSFPPDVTREQVVDKIRGTLTAFKGAHSKVEQAQQFVGLEFKL